MIGPSGKLLDTWLTSLNLEQHADIYLANTLRCMLPDNNAKPTARQFKACWSYLRFDLSTLQRVYKRVTVLLLGASACRLLKLGPLKQQFKLQGQVLEYAMAGEPPLHLPTFATYHPAALLPRRNPALQVAVADHLQLLSDHLLGHTATGKETVKWVRGAVPPDPMPALVSLDIETYGAVSSFPTQTVFHPEKSVQVDGVSRCDLIQTVALTWRDQPETVGSERAGLKSTVFVWSDEKDRAIFHWWMHNLRETRGTLLCMNTLFDIGYLKYASPLLDTLLTQPLVLEDLAVWNYLSSDVRPERSLEALSRLFGFLPPPQPGVSKKFHVYSRADDLKLLDYNVEDTILTLACRKRLRQDMIPRAKSERTRRWYSNLLWSCLHMNRAGVSFSIKKLRMAANHCLAQRSEAVNEAALRGVHPLQGKGSAKVIQTLVADAIVASHLESDSRVAMTPVSGRVSTGNTNLQLLDKNLPMMHPLRPAIEAVIEYRKASKLISSYLSPLLTDPFVPTKPCPHRLLDTGTIHITPQASRKVWTTFPQWFIVPQEYGGGTEGGTAQGRITCKNLALQTMPPLIQRCITSRFSPGMLLHMDLSQIELRMAAMLSGDPTMIEEYRSGVDRHTLRAQQLFGRSETAKNLTFYRSIGKMVNFLLIYRGGWRRLQESIRQRLGHEMPDDRCREIVDSLPKTYPVFTRWQNDLIRYVTKHGYLDEPLLGQRRWFTRSRTLNETDYESTIANFLVQTMSANLMNSIQYRVSSEFEVSNRGAVVVLNVYDALDIDCPLCQTSWVSKQFAKAVRNNSYLSLLKGRYQTVPIDYETETTLCNIR